MARRFGFGSTGLAIAAGLVATMFAGPPRAGAQGLVIDRRPHVPIARAFVVKQVGIDARVRDQVAEVQVTQTFHNPGSFDLEAEFLFPVPDAAALQNFVLMVDGRELTGRLLPKDEARTIYEGIVRSKRDPALLEYLGTGLIRTSVFPIPAGADRTVTMRYTSLLKRESGLVEFSYPFGTQKFTAKPIEKLTVTARIEAAEPIKAIYSPGHDVTIRRDGDREATITLDQRDVVPTNDFRLVYSLGEGNFGASVLSYRPDGSDDGFFLVLASPEVKPPDARPRPKSVVFVLDRSGSMAGKKIEQARGALKFVLDNLREGDSFNILAYDDRVETFRPELISYSDSNRVEAARYIENIRPGGSTNISGALETALTQLRDKEGPAYVVFLTDGLPTAGEVREAKIAERTREANPKHARIFAFGVGYDVNARLLDRLGSENGGTSEFVKPDEDIEAKVGRFYAKVTSPALTDLELDLVGAELNRTSPRDLPDLFEGGQLVWVGRYRKPGKATIRLAGKVGDERRTYEFPAELADSGRGSRFEFVETLWATRRVGFLIDQIDLHGKNSELTEELVALSRRYGILTPYTSFLADERTDLHANVDNFRRTEENLTRLSDLDGASGVGQRQAKADYARARGLQEAEVRFGAAPAAPASVGGGGLGGAPAASASGPVGRRAYLGRSPMDLAAKAATPEEVQKRALRLFQRGGTPVVAKDERGESTLVETVRRVGSKTFYRRNDVWFDAEIKPEDEAKAQKLEQFSEGFFALTRKQTAEENQFLTFDEPVVVKLADGIYRIDPSTQAKPVAP